MTDIHRNLNRCWVFTVGWMACDKSFRAVSLAPLGEDHPRTCIPDCGNGGATFYQTRPLSICLSQFSWIQDYTSHVYLRRQPISAKGVYLVILKQKWSKLVRTPEENIGLVSRFPKLIKVTLNYRRGGELFRLLPSPPSGFAFHILVSHRH